MCRCRFAATIGLVVSFALTAAAPVLRPRVGPRECTNLADDPNRRAVLDRLKAELSRWRSATGAPMLRPENVGRLKAEIEQTRQNGTYRKKKTAWNYPDYFFE